MSDKNNPLLTLSEQKRALIAQPPPADTHLAAARTNQQPAHAQHLCELNQHPSPLLAPTRVRDIAAPLAPGSRWLGVHTRKGGPASQEGSPSQQPCRNLDFSPANYSSRACRGPRRPGELAPSVMRLSISYAAGTALAADASIIKPLFAHIPRGGGASSTNMPARQSGHLGYLVTRSCATDQKTNKQMK